MVVRLYDENPKAVRWCEGPWASLVTPIKATMVGMGF